MKTERFNCILHWPTGVLRLRIVWKSRAPPATKCPLSAPPPPLRAPRGYFLVMATSSESSEEWEPFFEALKCLSLTVGLGLQARMVALMHRMWSGSSGLAILRYRSFEIRIANKLQLPFPGDVRSI